MDIRSTAGMLAAAVALGALAFAFEWARRRRPHARDTRTAAIACALGAPAILAALGVRASSVMPVLFVSPLLIAAGAGMLAVFVERARITRPVVAGFVGAAVLATLAISIALGKGAVASAAALDAGCTAFLVTLGLVAWCGPREHDRIIALGAGIGAFLFAGRLGMGIARIAAGDAPGHERGDLSFAMIAGLCVILMTVLLLAVLEDEAAWRRKLGLYDPLTQLLKRPEFFIDAQSKINAAIEKTHVIAICDVDHMENLNDALGREAGDEILTVLGEMTWRALPRHATAGRFADDEIVLFLPDHSLERATTIAESLRARVEAHDWPDGRAPGRKPTLSIGLAAYIPGERLDLALTLADAGLHTVKMNGRNAVRAVEPDAFEDPIAVSAAGGRSVRRAARFKAAA